MAEWKTPKTNWSVEDVPGLGDFERIEGNIQAIELGSRTVDQSLAPSGNVGNLRQILSWFANRLKAITGAANWYDAPATTLAYVNGLVGSLQAGTAFAYYLTPPDVELASSNTDYDDWWLHDVTRSVVVRILLPGTIRYHIQYRGLACHVRILLNGSIIRTEIAGSLSWRTATGNITVSPGDIITIQKKGGAASWRNVRIETAQPPLGIQRF